MSETILQSYLNAQHIKTSDQSNIDNLKKAVSEVKKSLEKKKGLIIPYTLVAIDPMVDEKDPVVQEVERIIIKNWSAFKNSVTATKDKSTTYVRAVILETLSQMADQNELVAAIIWYTSQDVVSHYPIGKEEGVITSTLQNLANKVENIARANWSIENKITINSFKGTDIKVNVPTAATVDENNLINQLKAGMIHSGWRNQGGGGDNPYHHGQHDWNWPKFMAEKSGKGIAEVINSALTSQNNSLSDIADSIKQGLDAYFAQLQPFFEKVSASYANSIAANNKRSQLLWWKQTLCSPRLGQSYRGFRLEEAAIVMAIDLADQVDPIYPLSVDYLLRETLKDVFGKDVDIPRPLIQLIDAATKMEEPIKTLIKGYISESDGRKPLLTELANVILTGNPKNFFSATGIDNKASISISDLAVWLLHGLQAKKISESK